MDIIKFASANSRNLVLAITLYVMDMNIICFILLGYIYFKSLKKIDFSSKYAIYLSATTINVLLLLIIESMTLWLSNTKQIQLLPLTTFLFTLQLQLGPSAAFLYLHAIYNYIKKDKSMSYNFKILSIIPIIINSTMVGTNVFTGLSFTISPEGLYSRGQWYLPIMIITICYLLSIASMLFINRKTLSKKEYYTFNLFWIFPLIGGLLQTIFYGSLMMWNFSAFSIMLILFYLETKLSKIDSLTGALTRASFETYMDSISDSKNFGLAFIDLDDFKEINDRYGHAEGDNALKLFSQIAQSKLSPSDLFVRYGGDEFVICFEGKSLDDISNTIHLIDIEVNKTNDSRKYPFKIKFSCGFDTYSEDKYYNPTHLLKTIDSQMYEKKLNKKLLEYTRKQKAYVMENKAKKK